MTCRLIDWTIAPILLLLPHVCHAILPASECDPVKIYFANGVLTDPADARISYRILEEAIRPAVLKHSDKYLTFDLAYNPSEGFLTDVVEAFDQKVPNAASKWPSFFPFALGGLAIKGIETWLDEYISSDGRRLLSEAARRLVGAGLYDDGTVRKHVAEYTKAMRSGERVMVIAHSQGNLYANAAFHHMASRPPAGVNLAAFGIAAIASPASVVATGDGHVNSVTDLVIQAVTAHGLVGLPPNDMSLPIFPPGDRLGHGFRTVYFNNSYPIRQRVQTSILNTLQRVMQKSATVAAVSNSEGLAATAPHDGMALTAQLAAAGMFFSNMTVFRNDGLPENPLTEFKLPNLPGKVGFAAVGGVGSGTVKPLQDLRVFKVRVASLSCKASVVARLSSGEERAAYIDGCGSNDPKINRYEIGIKTCRPSDRIEEVRMRGEAGGPFFLYELSFE